MDNFETPGPISVSVELGVGSLRVSAAERTETTVHVRPTDPDKKGDVSAAEQTRVEYENGALVVKAPKNWRQWSFRGRGESVDVEISLPSGSRLNGEAGVASVRSSGSLGDCRFKLGVGDIQIDEASGIDLRTGAGDVAIGRGNGDVEVSTGSGAVRIDSIEGHGVVKDSNGDISIGEVVGDLRVVSANGSISIDRAYKTVAAKTANGGIRIGEASEGSIVAETALGKVDIGIADGVPAWLDLHTSFGRVDNELQDSAAPGPGERSVDVRARTSFGDITVRRSIPVAIEVEQR